MRGRHPPTPPSRREKKPIKKAKENLNLANYIAPLEEDYDEVYLEEDFPEEEMIEASAAEEEKRKSELLCFDELLRLRNEICMKEKLPSGKFLSNAIIGRISKSPPENEAKLKEMLAEGTTPLSAIALRLLEKYNVAILAITRRFKK